MTAPSDRRSGGLWARCHRLPERVAFAAALWLLPSAAALVEPMTAPQTAAVRELAVTVLVVSVGSWAASQGKRRRELAPKADESPDPPKEP